MAFTPGALQLALLQTVLDVASEKNSTLLIGDRGARPSEQGWKQFLVGSFLVCDVVLDDV